MPWSIFLNHAGAGRGGDWGCLKSKLSAAGAVRFAVRTSNAVPANMDSFTRKFSSELGEPDHSTSITKWPCMEGEKSPAGWRAVSGRKQRFHRRWVRCEV